MPGPGTGRDSRGYLRFSDQCGNPYSMEISGQGSAFPSCTHSNIGTGNQADSNRQERETEQLGGHLSRSALQFTSLHSSGQSALAASEDSFMLKSTQAIFFQGFSQGMSDMLSDRQRTTINSSLSSTGSRTVSCTILCPSVPIHSLHIQGS